MNPCTWRAVLHPLAFALATTHLACLAGYGQTTDTIVRLAAAPRHPGVATAREELTIGVFEGASEYTFNVIVDIAVGNDGEVLVLDGPLVGGRANVRLYDADGRFRRQVGRFGNGPGEYRTPWGVRFLRDGRMALYDRMGARINVYTSDGDYADTWRIPLYFDGSPVNNEVRSDPSGGVAINIKVRATPEEEPVDAIVRVDSAGTVIDTLRVPPLPDVHEVVIVRRERVTSTFHVAYSPRSFWRWSPLGYLVTGVSDRYSVDLLLPRTHDDDAGRPPRWRTGDPVVSIRRDSAAVAVSPEERADQEDFLRSRTQRLRGRLEGRIPGTPRIKPHYRDFFVGDDGRIWVNVHTVSTRYTPSPREAQDGSLIPQLGWREAPHMDVFEPDGTFIGRVRMPYDFHPLTFRGDRVWGIVADALGVEYIKRYRVVWKPSSDSLTSGHPRSAEARRKD
jgi:6-bladed beta-propeller